MRRLRLRLSLQMTLNGLRLLELRWIGVVLLLRLRAAGLQIDVSCCKPLLKRLPLTLMDKVKVVWVWLRRALLKLLEVLTRVISNRLTRWGSRRDGARLERLIVLVMALLLRGVDLNLVLRGLVDYILLLRHAIRIAARDRGALIRVDAAQCRRRVMLLWLVLRRRRQGLLLLLRGLLARLNIGLVCLIEGRIVVGSTRRRVLVGDQVRVQVLLALVGGGQMLTGGRPGRPLLTVLLLGRALIAL